MPPSRSVYVHRSCGIDRRNVSGVSAGENIIKGLLIKTRIKSTCITDVSHVMTLKRRPITYTSFDHAESGSGMLFYHKTTVGRKAMPCHG